MLSLRYSRGDRLFVAERNILLEIVEIWRDRLSDVSWFMRILNESIAREASKVDQCAGRRWEGRLKSQAFLDEAALLSSMAYVDLNPVWACIAKTPEDCCTRQDALCLLKMPLKKIKYKVLKGGVVEKLWMNIFRRKAETIGLHFSQKPQSHPP